MVEAGDQKEIIFRLDRELGAVPQGLEAFSAEKQGCDLNPGSPLRSAPGLRKPGPSARRQKLFSRQNITDF